MSVLSLFQEKCRLIKPKERSKTLNKIYKIRHTENQLRLMPNKLKSKFKEKSPDEILIISSSNDVRCHHTLLIPSLLPLATLLDFLDLFTFSQDM